MPNYEDSPSRVELKPEGDLAISEQLKANLIAEIKIQSEKRGWKLADLNKYLSTLNKTEPRQCSIEELEIFRRVIMAQSPLDFFK